MPPPGPFIRPTGLFMPFQAVEAPFRTSSAGFGSLDCASERLLPASGPWKGVSGFVKPVWKAVGHGIPRSEPEKTVPIYAGRLAPGSGGPALSA
jgi:hypothetical protein